MTPMPTAFLDQITHWAVPAQLRLQSLRTLFHDVAEAAEIGPLDESLKWGQPAWRPRRPRTGSTLRLNWSPDDPDHITAFVDCKTDLAAQMQLRFPDLPGNDGRRALRFDLTSTNSDALWQLAFLTFTYHRVKQSSAH